jgi:hypothetical protein
MIMADLMAGGLAHINIRGTITMMGLYLLVHFRFPRVVA